MQLYWVSAIIQNKGDMKPWLCAMTDGEIKLEDAMKTIAKARNNHNVLSVWMMCLMKITSNKLPLRLTPQPVVKKYARKTKDKKKITKLIANGIRK